MTGDRDGGARGRPTRYDFCPLYTTTTTWQRQRQEKHRMKHQSSNIILIATTFDCKLQQQIQRSDQIRSDQIRSDQSIMDDPSLPKSKRGAFQPRGDLQNRSPEDEDNVSDELQRAVVTKPSHSNPPLPPSSNTMTTSKKKANYLPVKSSGYGRASPSVKILPASSSSSSSSISSSIRPKLRHGDGSLAGALDKKKTRRSASRSSLLSINTITTTADNNNNNINSNRSRSRSASPAVRSMRSRSPSPAVVKEQHQHDRGGLNNKTSVIILTIIAAMMSQLQIIRMAWQLKNKRRSSKKQLLLSAAISRPHQPSR